MTLLQAYQNKAYTIINVGGKKTLLHRRLVDMGFTQNARVFVFSIAPFKGTVLVSLRGSMIALRDDAATLINIKPI